jgi:glycosyltransferase involved in cell wall biosynthesis
VTLLVPINTEIWGGAEVFLWHLCGELCKRGVQIVVVCPIRGPVFRRFCELPLLACYQEEMGTAAGRFRGLGSLAIYTPGSVKRTLDLLGRMQAKHGCDVVLCQGLREQCLTAEVGSRMGYRSVWMMHSRPYYFFWRILLNSRLRRAMKAASLAFVFSESTKKAMAEDGFPKEVMHVMREAINIPVAIPARGDNDRPRIGVVSRLRYPKGVQNVLLAAHSILKAFPDVEFIIAGEGSYRARLESLAEKLKIKRSVRFLGLVQNPWEVFSQIDILAHATFDSGDSMPLAILEAGAAGVPVVATRWSGIPEIVRDGFTGMLVPPRDVAALTDALSQLLRDRSLASEMGNCARKWVQQNFGIAVVAQHFLGLLEGSFQIRF